MKLRFLVSLIFIFLLSNGYGQFSSDPEQFLKDIKKFMKSSNAQKTNDFLEVFEPNWLTNFSTEYQDKVVSTSNLIVSKGLNAFPHLYGYLLSAHSFVETNQPKESFESWHETIDALLNSKKKNKFEAFINICAGFFTDGTIFYSTNHIWQYKGGSYNFSFIKNNPQIEFDGGDLCCYAVNRKATKKEDPYFDSTIVRNTYGVYLPLNNKWTGRGGVIDWQKVGMDPEKNFAEITDYSMTLKSNKVETDSAMMTTEYYDTPLAGKVVDICKKANREVDRVYPNFLSFSKKIVKESILPEVDYVGGFALAGADFRGVGFGNEPAGIIFYKNGDPYVVAYGPEINVNSAGVRASECRVTMYLNEKDSIYHPGLNLRYDLNELEMGRSDDGLAQAPFKNSFHNLNMYVDRIIWAKDNPNLRLDWYDNANRKKAHFESENYFSEKVYTQIQGMNKVHPLVSLYNYSYKYDMETMPISKAATAMGFITEQAVPILLSLSTQGFLTYNKGKQTITLLPKTKNYIEARSGKKDYDNIVIWCNVDPIETKPETNPDGSANKSAKTFNKRAKAINDRRKAVPEFGTININSLDMFLNEVDPVEISPLQNVVVFPDEGKLQIQEGLDMLFGGAVMAGKLEAYLKDGSFDYSAWRINLLETEAVLFRVRPIFGGSSRLIAMNSHFEGMKGYIAIDDTTNRSGIKNKDFPDFPKLNSSKDSYVFYNHPSIYGGVYDSATFYFKADPFEFDSLDNFVEESMYFDGELRSAGIFPVFKEKIRIQEDYSFGFKTISPEGGFDFYGDNAKFDNEIKLSNEGLRGAGEIDFLTSNSVSENFVFFPDSTMGLSKYTNRPQTKDEGVSVPDVSGNGVMVTYVPKQKILKARAVKEPLKFFEEEATMFGMTKLTPDGMSGRGLMYFKDAELGSKNFKYKRWVIDADTADFNLADVGSQLEEGEKNPLSFNSNNLNAHVDFQERKGEFMSNEGTSIVEFPKNKYICYMDQFTWLMDNDEMELSKKEADVSIDTDLDLAGSNFFSVHPDQDSLNFAAPKAKFSIKDNVIRCDKVEFIDVADARISPPDKKLTIRKNAKMDDLDSATIIANFITKYHTITNAHVEINARKDYKADGYYLYTDFNGDQQTIYFEEITQDSAYQTVAKGDIAEDVGFALSPQFEFYGTAELKAAAPFLTFDGATRIKHECDQFAKNWLKFRTEINPEDIQIPVTDDMKDLNGNPIAVGIVRRNPSTSDSLGVYPTFLSALVSPADQVIFTSSGVLNYNAETREYRIASPEKLINREEVGNYIALQTQSCSMEGDGEVDLTMNLPDVEFKTYGEVKYDMATKQTTMNLSGGLNFFFDKKAMSFMADDIKGTEGIAGVDMPRTTLVQAIREDASVEIAENVRADYTIDGEVKKLPKEMEATMYLTNLRMKWNDRAGGFLSEPISGIVGLMGEPLFKDFTVRLSIQYSVEGGDRGTKMGYLVELPGGEKPGNYYFFRFERVKKNTQMYVITSNKDLQAYMAELKEDKTKQKNFSYELKTSKAAAYLSNFRSLFGG
ncbi:MAG: hypothetical protein MK078_16725 [Crocinitomicaceae bacterium]|nr:hypothetical protein [Crocinitomicaceae bacterium]